MEQFNKALVIGVFALCALFWLGVVLLFLFMPGETLAAARSLVSFLEGQNSLYLQVMFALLGLLFILASLLIIFLVLAPASSRALPLAQGPGGQVFLTPEAIAQRLTAEVEKVPQVQQAQARVTPRGRGVELRLDLETDTQAEPSAKGQEVMQLAREVVEGKLGVKVERLSVYLQPPSSPAS